MGVRGGRLLTDYCPFKGTIHEDLMGSGELSCGIHDDLSCGIHDDYLNCCYLEYHLVAPEPDPDPGPA